MFTYIEEDGEIVAIDDPQYSKEISEKRYNLLLKNSNIPDFYYTIDFKDYKGNKELESFKKVLYYANNCYKEEFNFVSLYIYGNNNTQKTAIACNILKQCMRKGLNAQFILAGVLIDKLMKLQGFSQDTKLYYEIEVIKNCDILLIDDIFDPNKSLFWKNSDNKNMIVSEWDIFLRDILAKKVKLIITSNFDKTIIKQYYGQSLYELIDRNFVEIEFTESIKEVRKLNVSAVFENMYNKEGIWK